MAAYPFKYVQVFIYTGYGFGKRRISLDKRASRTKEQAADAAGKPVGR
jgi:hypothetical protein